jgi:isocitrate lyase
VKNAPHFLGRNREFLGHFRDLAAFPLPDFWDDDAGELFSHLGYFHYRGGFDAAIMRALAYAPFADVLWCETSEPDIEQARRFARAVHARYPGKLLAYNCSPSFHWNKLLPPHEIAGFQRKLADLGYKYQFVTLAGFHSLNTGMFELARDYAQTGMTAYASLQEREFALAAASGYSAIRHQRFVGTGYFDAVQNTVTGGGSATAAMQGSTECAQFSDVSTGTPGEAAA